MALTVVDAGVLIGLLDGNDGHHASAVAALKAAGKRGDTLVLPVSAYAEVLVEPMRRGGDAVRLVDEAVERLSMRVEPGTRDIATVAASLRAKHGPRLRLPDAFVLATAQALHARRLLTTDRALKGISRTVVIVD